MKSNGIKKGNVKLTLSINKDILEKFKEVCKTKGIIISKQVEMFMEKQLKNEKD